MLEEFRAGIVVPVDAVAEAVQSEGIGLVLGVADAVFGREAAFVDAFEHFHDFHVGPAVERPPQSAHRGGTGREEIGLSRPHHPRRRRAAVLFVVAVQNEHQVQRIFHFRRHDVLLVGNGEHHVQEVVQYAAADRGN